ncbi:MAG: GNAT family N-acetyltransferase [Candidatus Krumholzibacteria bacterium]|nr:GNAT family N-acetyltransferase [Candidatus Krumholzibacteria bacterium]
MKTGEKHPVVVRDATPDDIEFIADCNCLLAEETEDKTLDRSVLVSGLRRGFASPGMCRYFIAESGGRRAGMTMLTYELTDWRDGVIWWLQSVYVLPDFRNLGVFRTVYHHIERLARSSAEVRALRLYVRRDNRHALETYKALGMSDAGYEVLEDDWSGGA